MRLKKSGVNLVLIIFILATALIFIIPGVSAACYGSDESWSGSCDANGNPTSYSDPCYRLGCSGGSSGVECNFQGRILDDGTPIAAILFSASGSSGATDWERTARPDGCGLSTRLTGTGDPSDIDMYTNNNDPQICPPNYLYTNHPALSSGEVFSYSVNGITASFTCEEGALPQACSGHEVDIVARETGINRWSDGPISIILGESIDLSWWYEPSDPGCDSDPSSCEASGSWSGSKACIDEEYDITPSTIGSKSYTMTWNYPNDGAYVDTVDVIVNEPTVTVTSPNGGEDWQIDSAQTITWNASDVIENVTIELSRDSGGSWTTLFSNTPNDGSQSWTVTSPSTTNALIRISDVSNSSFSDTSDSVFTISEVSNCELTSSSWSDSEVNESTEVFLTVQGSNCDGEALDFYIGEVDCIGGCTFNNDLDSEDTSQLSVSWIRGSFSGSTAVVSWIAEWVQDTNNGAGDIDPEYVFKASLAADSSNEIDNSGMLKVREKIVGCEEIIICADYTDEPSCNLDGCEVSSDSVPQDIDCDDPDTDCACEWDSTTSECDATWTATSSGTCGDGIINPGEQCDGSEWGPITGCGDFGLTDGTLTCGADCKFNTSSCIGDAGICGDGSVNPGETCDSGIGDFTCGNFDEFTSGSLSCDSQCQFDTSSCSGGTGDLTVGKCVYTQTTDDTCDDDGFLEFNLIANWEWDDDCDATCQSANVDKEAECTDSVRVVECPAQIPLPFFGVYNIIAALVLVGMVYWILNLRKSKKK